MVLGWVGSAWTVSGKGLAAFAQGQTLDCTLYMVSHLLYCNIPHIVGKQHIPYAFLNVTYTGQDDIQQLC